MIPFTQYHLPNGRKTQEEFPCDNEAIQHFADLMLKKGYRFEAEILRNGTVSLTVVGKLPYSAFPDEELDITISLCRNEPGFVKNAVEILVMRAVDRIGKAYLHA